MVMYFTYYLELSLKLGISPFRVYAIHGKVLNPRTLSKEQRNKLALVIAYLKEVRR
jgi:hypothetical protein